MIQLHLYALILVLISVSDAVGAESHPITPGIFPSFDRVQIYAPVLGLEVSRDEPGLLELVFPVRKEDFPSKLRENKRSEYRCTIVWDAGYADVTCDRISIEHDADNIRKITLIGKLKMLFSPNNGVKYIATGSKTSLIFGTETAEGATITTVVSVMHDKEIKIESIP